MTTSLLTLQPIDEALHSPQREQLAEAEVLQDRRQEQRLAVLPGWVLSRGQFLQQDRTGRKQNAEGDGNREEQDGDSRRDNAKDDADRGQEVAKQLHRRTEHLE